MFVSKSLLFTRFTRLMMAGFFLLSLGYFPAYANDDNSDVINKISASPEISTNTPTGYRLGVGDVLDVNIYNEADLSGAYRITDTGSIVMPLIGDVPLDGLSLRQATYRITNLFKSGYLIAPDVSLDVQNYRPFYILGAVNNPGAFAYVDDMNVLKAVALAGGFTSGAKQQNMRVLRKDDYQDIAAEDAVRPSDIVWVRKGWF